MNVIVESPAKINLTLEVLSKRPNGYHDIRSVLVPISLYDTIEVSGREDGLITCTTVGDGVDVAELRGISLDKNLAVKAANMVKKHFGVALGCDIKITKRIPIGAGMAGGSADAAGVIIALKTLWNLDVSKDRLLLLAANIGSDVPALVHGGAVIMEGRGEVLTPVLRPKDTSPSPFYLVVVFPGFPISTEKIYKNCSLALTPDDELCHNIASSVRDGDARRASLWLQNGLQDTVFKLYFETEYFCLVLRNGGALSSIVSGSGSAVFGLAESYEHALRIQSCLPKNVWSKVVSPLPDGVMAAHGPLVP